MDLRVFLSELKRRRVYRVAAVYVVVAFALLQAADIIFPALGLPPWTMTLVVVVAFLGFPAALALAWAFDITPEGIRRTGVAPARRAASTDPISRHTAGQRTSGGRRAAGGRYELREKLGAGAMGVVYRAHDLRLQRDVALKFLPEAMDVDTAAAARFLQEARAAAALNHPNITTLHAIEAIEDDDERPFLVMELVEGETLEARLARSGPLPVEEAVAIATQVAAGLAAAHAKGIVHRDIKPANLMLTPEGRVKIMDFGIAKVPGGPAVTREGSTLGSAAYMCPEQVRGEEVDGRSDLWALGAVLYEMLSGRLPFPGDNQHTVLHGVLHVEPEPLELLRPDAPAWLAELVMRLLSKERRQRPESASTLLAALRRSAPATPLPAPASVAPRRSQSVHWRLALIAPAVVVLALPAAWMLQRESRLNRARDIELPALLALVDAHDCLPAVMRADALERLLPGDRELSEARARCSVQTTILTQPAGADVYLRGYGDPEGDWYHLGTAPLNGITLPYGFYHWRVEKPGYAPVEQALPSWVSDAHLAFRLVPEGEAPDGMVRVPGGPVYLAGVEIDLQPYWIDRYEVTNAQYQAFVDAGGYRDPAWWREPFVHYGRTLEWTEAMALLQDATGQPGPATWELASHPEAEPDHPVGGVSWYEAAAYCGWAGKELPTVFHWKLAAGGDATAVSAMYSEILLASNFSGDGPVPVGGRPGISRYGAYDMAGNIKEWTWNPTGHRRYLLGGGWNEPHYMFNDLDARPPLEREATHGFRCARYDQPPAENATAALDLPYRSPPSVEPVSDEIYQVLIRPFAYDDSPLNVRVEAVDESSPHWRKETVTIDAAYGGERIPVHLYFPRNASPPYQSVVFFPSATARRLRQWRAAEVNYAYFVPRSGRVLVHPVLKGTYERGVEVAGPQALRDLTIQQAKDVRRSVDYLLTRDDIDPDRIAYLGISWGARVGPMMTALEDRFAASVLVSGGLGVNTEMPEISEANFAPRVRVPTLMINGRHDFLFPYEARQLPLFQLLGTPERDKALRLLESGHVPDARDVIRESNAWLDRYLEPVGR